MVVKRLLNGCREVAIYSLKVAFFCLSGGTILEFHHGGAAW